MPRNKVLIGVALLTLFFGYSYTNTVVNAKECQRASALTGWEPSNLSQLLDDARETQRSQPKMVDERIVNTNNPIGHYRSQLARNFAFPSFAIISDRFSRSDLEEIILPAPTLLCLLAPPAILLLSDGTTNHYVLLKGVNDSAGNLRIVDGWPSQSFLIGSDLSPSERGKLIDDGTIIEAPISTVMSFLVGAILPEEGDGFIRRLGALTDLDTDANNLLAIGLSLYADDRPQTFEPSLDYISRAAAVAKREQISALELSANRQLAMEAILSAMADSQDMTKEQRESYIQRFEALGGDAILRETDVRATDLLRISRAFENRKSTGTAYFLANLATQRDALLDDAFLQRARILIQRGRYDLALPDAREAYRLNTQRIHDTLKKPTDNFLQVFYDNFGGALGILALQDITLERHEIFRVLADVYSEKKMYNELLALSDESNKFMSRNYFTALIRAEAEFGLGRNDLGRQDYARAITLEPSAAELIKKRLRQQFGNDVIE